MKNHLTKQRIIAYTIYFVLACALVSGVTYARYQTEVTGTGTASVAAVAMNSEIDLTNQLKDLVPGGTKTITFAVNNFDGSDSKKVSEVSQEYSITINTTGNLPLQYELSGELSGTGEGAGTVVTKQAGGGSSLDSSLVWTGGELPHSTKTAHTYTLTVDWPADKNDSAYADEIDLVTLTVDAKQVKPESKPAAGTAAN